MPMPAVEDGPWAHSDIFHEPTDPDMVEYLGRKRESLQNQVGKRSYRCILSWIVQ